MTDIEDLITQTMRLRSSDADAGQAWPPTHRRERPTVRRPSAIVFAACAALLGFLAFGAGAFYLVQASDTGKNTSAASAFGPDAVSSSFRGVKVSAPASFSVLGYGCSGPSADTIVVGPLRSYQLCFASPTNGHTVITLADAESAEGKQLTTLATTPRTIGTFSGFEGEGPDPSTGQQAVVVYVPSQNVVIRGIGPDLGLARAILGTAENDTAR